MSDDAFSISGILTGKKCGRSPPRYGAGGDRNLKFDTVSFLTRHDELGRLSPIGDIPMTPIGVNRAVAAASLNFS